VQTRQRPCSWAAAAAEAAAGVRGGVPHQGAGCAAARNAQPPGVRSRA
jgi:hypothetical protein